MKPVCPRCGCDLHDAEPDVGIMSAGCPDCHWYEGCHWGPDEDDAGDLDADEQDEHGPAPESEAEAVGDPGFAFGGPR